MNSTTVAVDLAKNVFELAVAGADWRIGERHRLGRAKFSLFSAPLPGDPLESEVCLSAHDIVLELPGDFGTEIILSDAVLNLPGLPTRLNRVVHVKDNVRPVLTIEAFEIADNVFPVGRFPTATNWV